MNSITRGRAVTAKDKQYRALYREYRKLLQIKQSAPIIELDEPYQRGWMRCFYLRHDASRRDDVKTLKEILNILNVYQYCRKGTFTQKNGRTKAVSPIGHHLKNYSIDAWKKQKETNTYDKYFEMRLVSELNWKHQIVRNQKYVFKYPFYFVSTIEKHFVTHRVTAMPEVETRIAEIETHFDHNQILSRLDNLRGQSWHWKRKPMLKSNNEYRAIQSALAEINEDEL